MAVNTSPRTVRNFWIEASIDGQRSEVAGGPKAMSGGLDATLYQRKNGQVEEALTIWSRVDSAGSLITEVRSPDGRILYRYETER